MITELARLHVRPGLENAFEEAFVRARPLIAATPGFLSLRLLRCLEEQAVFLLLVEWERLEDHQVGFRESDRYPEWSALLHPFYDPFPTVEHYCEV